MMGMTRRRFVHGTGAALLAGAAPLSAFAAEAWPTKPVKFIVPLAAGGGLDFVARIIGDHLSRELGQQVFIENRTGAGGTIGIDAAIKSPPDGYSLLVTNDNVASAPHVLQLNVDYLNDLLPVVEIGRQPQAIAVHPTLGVNTLQELVAMAKQTPSRMAVMSMVGVWFSIRRGRLRPAWSSCSRSRRPAPCAAAHRQGPSCRGRARHPAG